MSLPHENTNRLFAAARNAPLELNREQVELLFLNPVPTLPVKPWYASYLKYFKMLSFLLATVIGFTVVFSTEDAATAETPISAVIPRPETPPTGLALQATTPKPAPVVEPTRPHNSRALPTTSPALNTAPAPAPAPSFKQRNLLEKELTILATESTIVGPTSSSTSATNKIQQKAADILPPNVASRESKMAVAAPDTLRPSLPGTATSTPPRQVAAVKWGLEQAGYIVDTLKTCCNNRRIINTELKMKGKFRLMLNPNMSRKYMIVYGKPAAIAALQEKVSYRKIVLKNPLKDLVVDLEINPVILDGFRIKNNKTELVDYQ